MENNFSDKLKNIIISGTNEAIRMGHTCVGTEHLLLAMIADENTSATKVLKGFDINYLKQKIENRYLSKVNEKRDILNTRKIPLNPHVEIVLNGTITQAQMFKHSQIRTVHLLLSILYNEQDPLVDLLNTCDVNYNNVKSQMEMLFSQNRDFFATNQKDDEDMFEDEDIEPQHKASDKNLKTPMLDSFGRDLTKFAQEGKLDPVVGREKEIERVSQILSRRKKNNPLLIGEPGVGKSAIAEGLALRIVRKKVSRVLFNKRVVMLDVASLVAGTKYRGQFEERMKALMAELEKHTDVILFIDEIHTMVGAGGSGGALDASNMFKPALARGELQCIGATTLDECRQHIEKDGALVRRFQKVMIEPTSIEETITILENIKEKYEVHHNVSFTKDAIESCVKLTDRYITDRFFPDKAIDVLDESGSRVHITNIKVPKEILNLEKDLEKIKQDKGQVVKDQQYEEAARLRDLEKNKGEELLIAQQKWEEQVKDNRETVSGQNVAEVVSMMTGIPVSKVAEGESKKLVAMPAELKSKVIGQDEAISKIVKAIQRNRVGLKDPNKPIGSFVFLGPTGVGKTQLAKMLSSVMFDSKDALIRMDMSEYMEKFSVSRLIGSPPGYVGYEEGGQLTEKVRCKPYSVVLLDEIEKAHPDVFNLLLQILDDGYITDSMGRRINFSNTIIIMTSNIGIRQLNDFGNGVGFGTSAKNENVDDNAKQVIQLALKKYFAPEFLNRLDDVILFNSLKQKDILSIIDMELIKLAKRLDDLGYKISVTQKAKEYIVKQGYDIHYGARPLNRAIQKHIEDKLAEELIRDNISGGDIKVDIKNDEIKITFSKKKTSKSK